MINNWLKTLRRPSQTYGTNLQRSFLLPLHIPSFLATLLSVLQTQSYICILNSRMSDQNRQPIHQLWERTFRALYLFVSLLRQSPRHVYRLIWRPQYRHRYFPGHSSIKLDICFMQLAHRKPSPSQETGTGMGLKDRQIVRYFYKYAQMQRPLSRSLLPARFDIINRVQKRLA